MKFLEKNLEDIVFNTQPVELYNRGLDTTALLGKKKRQLKIGNYGIADIVYFEKCRNENLEPCLKITVFELKKDCINIDSLLQAVRYIKGIDRYIFNKRQKDLTVTYSVILIGERLDLDSSFVYLTDFLYNSGVQIQVFTYQYEFDGIKFNEQNGFYLRNEGF